MIKCYFLKLLPIFLWISSRQLCNADSSKIDAIRAEDEQVKIIFIRRFFEWKEVFWTRLLFLC